MKKLYSLVLFLIAHFLFSQNTEANDCVNYIQVCGNQSIQLNPTGIGVQEIGTNVCQGAEHNSLWIKFNVKTSGTLGFDLIPEDKDISVDYDFWIFGPNVSCGKLGIAIRCSTTNPEMAGTPNNHTGMRDSEPDGNYFEGPGWNGDNYVKSLNVVAGETYFLVIDRPVGDGAFSLNWTGTAELLDPFKDAPNPFITPETIKVCKPTDLYDLSTYSTQIVNSNPNFSVSYFTNYSDANYNINAITTPIALTQSQYFFRIQSTISECFDVGKIDVQQQPLVLLKPTLRGCKNGATAIYNLTEATVANNPITFIKYYKTQAEAEAHIPGTEIPDPTNYYSEEGKVYVWVKVASGCENFTEINLKYYPIPNVDTSRFTTEYCDENLDGKITVDLKTITSSIVNNASNFDIVYYLPTNPAQTYTTDIEITGTTTLTIEVKSKDGCPSAKENIILKVKPKVAVTSPIQIEICDEKLIGSVELKLSDYTSLFNTTATATFFKTIQDARSNVNSIGDNQTIVGNTTYYYRFESSINCPQVGTLQIFYKSPKHSTILPSEVLICKNEKTDLFAGLEFDSYLWSTGSTSEYSGPVGAGDHWVELGFNGCIYKQFVKVKEDSDITLQNVVLENNRVTISATGGTPPYQYSLNGTNWHTSNTLENVPFGTSYIYVKSARGCIFSFEIFNLQLINAITPNNDGKNEALDFSGLDTKEEVKFLVFDKYGKVVYKGGNHQYKWDGKVAGKVVATDTYWYIIEWTDPLNKQKFVYKSWVLVKNRN